MLFSEAMAERTGTVIVGAGVCGLKAAWRLSREGLGDFVVLDKLAATGGVWRSFANKSSCAQVAEPSYRLVAEQPTTNFTPCQDLLHEMDQLCLQGDFVEKLRFGCEMTSVRDLEGDGVEVQYRDASGALRTIIAADHVLLCTGGLQQPRLIDFPGEESFQGKLLLGTGSQVDSITFKGSRVVVLGMGAFAVESVRTALLGGAEHVTIVARKLNLIIPRLAVLMGALRSSKNLFKARPNVEEKFPEMVRQMMPMMVEPYRRVGAEHLIPEGMKAVLAGTPGAGVGDLFGSTAPTASDFFFMAFKLGLVDVVVGDVARFGPDGLHISPKSPEAKDDMIHIPCDVVIKCFGFDVPDAHLAALVGRERLRSPMYITERILLMKGERNPGFVGVLGPTKGFVDFGGSIVMVSDLYLEIFMHFRCHPDELPAILEALPNPTIKDDSFSDMMTGLYMILEAVPALKTQLGRLRTEYASRVSSKLGASPVDILLGNKSDWEETCSAITGGDRKAVPYLWENMLKMMSSPAALGQSPSAKM